jgi:hypothetical protein
MARVAIVAAVLAIIGAVAFWFFLPTPISPEAQTALAEWMADDCQVGEAHHAEIALRQYSRALDAPLAEIAEKGPPAADLARVDGEARRRYEVIRTALRSGQRAGLTPLYSQALLAQTADAYATRAREDYEAGQISTALAGLGITGGRRGRRLLEKVAADPKSPFRDNARRARYGESPAAKN